MAKLIPMHEAAQMLGLTVEQLNELRKSNELYAYRDGSSWKFKEEELRRVASKLRAAPDRPRGNVPSGNSGSGIDDDLEKLVDVSELQSADEASSTSSDAVLPDVNTGTTGAAASSQRASISDSELPESLGDDDVLRLAEQMDEAHVAPSQERGNRAHAADSASVMDNSDELRLASDEDFELSSLETEPAGAKMEDEEDDFTLSDAQLDLGAESELDLVLDDSSSADNQPKSIRDESRPHLAAGSDDEVSAEESPTDLDAETLDELELGEDEIVSVRRPSSKLQDTAEVKVNDDFLLTPVEEASALDESDSGSQVIELDEDFEGADHGMFEESGEPVLGVEEDPDLATLPEGRSADAAAAEMGTAAFARLGEPTYEEYSGWNIAGLSLIVLVFIPLGLMLIDLMRNMWSWTGTSPLSSPVMDAILSMFGG